LLFAVLTALLFVSAGAGRAQSIDDEAHRIGQTLQCPVCEGHSVAESPSQLATQMRAVIREKLSAGESDQQISQYFVDRYGESVLRIPPRSGFTAIAWIVPYLALALAVVFLVQTVRRRKHAAVPTTPGAVSPDPSRATPGDASLDPYLEEVDRTYDQVRDEALR
jgi:cytochrome c-type biogenesis protein CcmH